jgi:hypothetical protein
MLLYTILALSAWISVKPDAGGKRSHVIKTNIWTESPSPVGYCTYWQEYRGYAVVSLGLLR